jgi:TatD DNase family protein
MIADTHAHLDMLADPVAALCNAAQAGVGLVVTVVNVLEKPERTFEQLESWREAAGRNVPDAPMPQVPILVGTHPHVASKTDDEAMARITRYAKDPRVVGLGELGLDFHYDHSPRDVQCRVFEDQLQLAHELDLPVCIHLREAHEDGLRILTAQGVPRKGAILHCFGLGFEAAQPFLELGCYVSFAGPITFKKADEIRDAAARISLDKILTETDCPFLAPEPMRGRKNEPANVAHIVRTVAQARGISYEECSKHTLENAKQIFGL